MNRRRRQNGGLGLVVIAAFLSFLVRPQVVSLRHDHPGGEHLHSHLQFLVPPTTADEHDLHIAHHHPHTTSTPHAGNHTHRPPHTRTTAAYLALAPGHNGHWHLFNTLHLSNHVAAPLWLPRFLRQSVLLAGQPSPFFSPRQAFQPRAPPSPF